MRVYFSLLLKKVERIVDDNGIILQEPPGESIYGVSRPTLSSNGQKIAFVTEKDRERIIYSHDLTTSQLDLISKSGGLPAMTWIDDQTLLYTQQDLGADNVVYTTIYQRRLPEDAKSVVALPVKQYLMALTYGDNFAVFSCPTRENIEKLKVDQDNGEYLRPVKMCYTRIENNMPGNYSYFQMGNQYEVSAPFFTYGKSNSYEIFFACKDLSEKGLCKLTIADENIEKVVDVRESFFSVIFDFSRDYAFVSSGALLNLVKKEEVDLGIEGKKLEEDTIAQFLPFAYRP